MQLYRLSAEYYKNFTLFIFEILSDRGWRQVYKKEARFGDNHGVDLYGYDELPGRETRGYKPETVYRYFVR